jgi:hypothetical protein
MGKEGKKMTNKEAQLALANLKRHISGGGVIDRCTNRAIDMAIKALEQPEIVYCRYCEHAKFVKMGVWCCKGGGGLVSPDFFCGHGKKRKEVAE